MNLPELAPGYEAAIRRQYRLNAERHPAHTEQEMWNMHERIRLLEAQVAAAKTAVVGALMTVVEPYISNEPPEKAQLIHEGRIAQAQVATSAITPIARALGYSPIDVLAITQLGKTPNDDRIRSMVEGRASEAFFMQSSAFSPAVTKGDVDRACAFFATKNAHLPPGDESKRIIWEQLKEHLTLYTTFNIDYTISYTEADKWQITWAEKPERVV